MDIDIHAPWCHRVHGIFIHQSNVPEACMLELIVSSFTAIEQQSRVAFREESARVRHKHRLPGGALWVGQCESILVSALLRSQDVSVLPKAGNPEGSSREGQSAWITLTVSRWMPSHMICLEHKQDGSFWRSTVVP
eukprot:GHVU01223340.1.p1 GENE.GHVU01223340.1~~GHVU01223340.1.p1  ORF type:complete len:136 (-),score=2.16 GHVU01223340.1:569-976(-)